MNFIIKTIFLTILSSVVLFGFSDIDFDGVDDSIDKCPNTPITDLVDENGCSIKSVIVDQYFDMIFGVSYSQLNYRSNKKTDTYTTTAQVDYYRGNFTLQFQSSYFRSDGSRRSDKGWNDTSVSANYKWKLASDFTVRAGIGLVLPTYDTGYSNNKTDYTVNLNCNYKVEEWSFFAGYNYMLVGDNDVITKNEIIRYQNTDAFNLGVGYDFTPKLNASISYYQSDSIYRDVETIKNISLYGFYSIDSNWFTTISYAKGLTDSTSDNYVELRVGYYF
ncbi:porin [Hydrogenimonas thermophila]|uniref:DUF3187 domain-containing protein n=1 Tax=Hydrogenimonas thermophila TaxID=223786 RepID=A0A1I5Q495_9BACT|nr:porin [Hydrogenimonas thermophila]SFP41022.1 hypothetical protein SAMN05216234_11830 [Hydrogenimonas thermophila]